jgi:hypothetical protein
LVWNWFEWDAGTNTPPWEPVRPQLKEQLTSLVSAAFQASLQTEEGRPIRFHVLFDQAPRQVTVTFERPLNYDAGQLLRLAPVVGIGQRWLVVTPKEGGTAALQIVGICDPDLSPHQGPVQQWWHGVGGTTWKVSGIPMSVLGPGWVRIVTRRSDAFELNRGSVRRAFPVNMIPPVHQWYQQVPDLLGLRESVAAEKWLETELAGRELVSQAWARILRKVCDARHGGCFLVVPDTAALPTDTVKIKYRLESGQVQGVVKKRMTVEPGLSHHTRGQKDIEQAVLDEGHFLEHDMARMGDFVAALAAVDGAVVLGRNLWLAGFGAEIIQTSPPPDEFVKYVNHPDESKQPNSRPVSGFGMRHRSGYRFCNGVPGAIAFVVSQDGDLRVFGRFGSELLLFEGASPERWVLY